MAASYLPYRPDQSYLLPPSLGEWLPEGHLAYFISETVDTLDLSAFHARYAGGGPGNQPFHPAMMVKVLIYGYASGVFSSRKLARKLYEDVALRVLAAGNFPAHRTLSDFRALHLTELENLFVQVVQLARECGLVKLGTIAVDGTKVKANASRHKAMSYKRMKPAEDELHCEIKALLDRAKATDDQERNEPELDIPAEISRREKRLEAIQAAKARLEARQREADQARGRSEDDGRRPRHPDGSDKGGGSYKREFGVPDDRDQESFTDPDSRIMKHAGGGSEQSYNGYTAVDAEHQIIVAAELTNCARTVRRCWACWQQFRPTPEKCRPRRWRMRDSVVRLFWQRSPITTAMSSLLGREGREDAKVNAKTHPHTAAIAAKLKTEQGDAAYRRRKSIVEAPNGWIKAVMGLRQFSMRGLDKVQAEWKLVCMALNLRRMAYL